MGVVHRTKLTWKPADEQRELLLRTVARMPSMAKAAAFLGYTPKALWKVARRLGITAMVSEALKAKRGAQ